MFITLAICTWNRASSLDDTLKYISRMDVPDNIDWEVLIINNNCNDRTSDVINQWSYILPLREVSEPMQGLSHARNRAIEQARGDFIIWTDDDVHVGPNLIREYRNAADQYAEASFFGGPVLFTLDNDAPRWLRNNFETFVGAYAARSLPEHAHKIDEHHNLPYGANFAIRKTHISTLRFDPTLGRRADEMLSGEETLFLARILEQGGYGVWLHNAKVEHAVERSRLTRKYLWNYYHATGMMRARGSDPCRPWHVRKLRFRYFRSRLKCVICSALKNQPWASAFVDAAEIKGILDELRDTHT